eukprot:gene17743-24103_t
MQQAKRVLVATPCYGGTMTAAYFLSILKTLSAVSSRPDIRLSFYTLSNESLITRARNTCVAHFLAHDFTHLFFIDADVEFQPEAFLRLVDCGKDNAAAVSAASGGGADAPQLLSAALNFNINVANIGTSRDMFDRGFARVKYGATGFMIIRRSVFDAMRMAYPDQQYVNDTLDEPAARPHNWLFFDCALDPETRQYLSEDYSFCRKWVRIGGTVWADVVSPLTHVGTHRFEGNVWLKLTPEQRAMALSQAL